MYLAEEIRCLIYQGAPGLDRAGCAGDQRGQELPTLAQAARRPQRGPLLWHHTSTSGTLSNAVVKLKSY